MEVQALVRGHAGSSLLRIVADEQGGLRVHGVDAHVRKSEML